MSAPIAHGEGARGLLVADFRQAVGIHRVDVVILLEREGMEVLVALGEADAIGRLARGDDDLAHAELHRRLDDVVGADDVGGEGDVVGLDQHARNGGEMHDRVGRATAGGRARSRRKPKCEVSALNAWPESVRSAIERVDARQVERLEIDVEDRRSPWRGGAARRAGRPCRIRR